MGRLSGTVVPHFFSLAPSLFSLLSYLALCSRRLRHTGRLTGAPLPPGSGCSGQWKHCRRAKDKEGESSEFLAPSLLWPWGSRSSCVLFPREQVLTRGIQWHPHDCLSLNDLTCIAGSLKSADTSGNCLIF